MKEDSKPENIPGKGKARLSRGKLLTGVLLLSGQADAMIRISRQIKIPKFSKKVAIDANYS